MNYLVSVTADTADWAAPTEMVAIDAFDDRLSDRGTGSSPADSGRLAVTLVDNRGGEAMLTDGPFLELGEHLAGFWIVEAPDLDEARTQAVDGPKAGNRKAEVRPIL